MGRMGAQPNFFLREMLYRVGGKGRYRGRKGRETLKPLFHDLLMRCHSLLEAPKTIQTFRWFCRVLRLILL
jgi:hypothetical protein